MGSQAPAFRSGKRWAASFLSHPPFRFQGSKGSQAWLVVVRPTGVQRGPVVTAHLEPIIRPALEAASAASSVKQEAGLGGERRGRESASATEAGRSASRSSLPLGAIRALRVTLWETPQSTSGVGLRRFCTSWALGGAAPCGSRCAGLARSGALQARGPAARSQGGGRRGWEHSFWGTITPGVTETDRHALGMEIPHWVRFARRDARTRDFSHPQSSALSELPLPTQTKRRHARGRRPHAGLVDRVPRVSGVLWFHHPAL